VQTGRILGIKITSKTNWKQKGIRNLAIFVQNGRILGVKIPLKKQIGRKRGTLAISTSKLGLGFKTSLFRIWDFNN